MDHLGCLCSAFSGQSWFQLKWVEQVQGHSITVKELIPIVVATAVWGPTWRGSSVQVLCDNAAVVAILNQNSSRDKEVMHLIRCLAFITAKFQFLLSASHIPGVENTAADAFSRNKLDVYLLSGQLRSCSNSSSPPGPSLAVQTRLYIMELDRIVERYFQQGLAPSTRRTYGSAQRQYLSFCSHHHCTPIPSSEQLLCQFAAHLAVSGLQASTIKCCFSAIRQLHIAQGVGDPGIGSMAMLFWIFTLRRSMHPSRKGL